jgi:hypothetical protein
MAGPRKPRKVPLNHVSTVPHLDFFHRRLFIPRHPVRWIRFIVSASPGMLASMIITVAPFLSDFRRKLTASYVYSAHIAPFARFLRCDLGIVFHRITSFLSQLTACAAPCGTANARCKVRLSISVPRDLVGPGPYGTLPRYHDSQHHNNNNFNCSMSASVSI